MRITLAVEVRLPPDVHVYAPGTKGYKPIKLLLDPIPQLQLQPVVYPPSKTLYLPAIKEQVPVHIRQDIQVATGAEFWGSLGKDETTFTITGKLEYQACDKTTCYVPTSVPVKWQLQLFPLDRTRDPWTFGTNKALCAVRARLVHLLDFTAGEKILSLLFRTESAE
jgi:hypothetical protein